MRRGGGGRPDRRTAELGAMAVRGLLRFLGTAVGQAARRIPAGPRTGRRSAGSRRPVVVAPGAPPSAGELDYRPYDDGQADPGEVVWAWVPFDEGDGRGKDRPVLVIGRRGAELLGLQLTSKDHDRDAGDEARHGRIWTDVGTGAWDSRGRPSEVRLDRLLVLDAADVRREGAALDRARFDRVVAEAARVQGW